MPLLLRDLALDLSMNERDLQREVASRLGVATDSLQEFRIVRRSVDARRKYKILKVYSVTFTCNNEDELLRGDHGLRLEPFQVEVETAPAKVVGDHHALVVGMGPAGLFAAMRLAQSGVQVTLIDRGRAIEQRVSDVELFWSTGRFNAHSNVQFGEGGAGTFSDGKLTTRLNHPQRHAVLKTLVECGAPEQILVEARPHVGTDRLRKVVINFRRRLAGMGVDIRFETCLTDLEVCRGRVVGAILDHGESLACDSLLIAPGHSARDTYRMLDRHRVQLEAKGFAVGVRVEHPSVLINEIQYGKFANRLPAADYTLRYNDPETGRGVYSFCMCPGGEVINAASEADGLVVNGMSRMARGSQYSNSALVVTVNPADWGGERLGGIAFQQQWERAAFAAGGATFKAPAQNMMAFVGKGNGDLSCSCRPGVAEVELREVLPDFVYHGLQSALPHFNRKMRGFVSEQAVLIGVETRTSAPLRISRDQSGQSVSHPGLYPVGEGAGYAGGIMSAALDGLKVADQLVTSVLN